MKNTSPLVFHVLTFPGDAQHPGEIKLVNTGTHPIWILHNGDHPLVFADVQNEGAWLDQLPGLCGLGLSDLQINPGEHLVCAPIWNGKASQKDHRFGCYFKQDLKSSDCWVWSDVFTKAHP